MVCSVRLDMYHGTQQVPLPMFQQLLNITATAEHCFRLIQRRHVGVVEINKYECTWSLGHRTLLLTTRTCMCKHKDPCLVPNTKHDHDAMTILRSLILQTQTRFLVSMDTITCFTRNYSCHPCQTHAAPHITRRLFNTATSRALQCDTVLLKKKQ